MISLSLIVSTCRWTTGKKVCVGVIIALVCAAVIVAIVLAVVLTRTSKFIF